jgi:hypothetical protein
MWVWLSSRRARARVLARERRGSPSAGGVLNVGIHMKTVFALLKDKAGSSSTKLALMIGLASSGVLILVRVGVAATSQ